MQGASAYLKACVPWGRTQHLQVQGGPASRQTWRVISRGHCIPFPLQSNQKQLQGLAGQLNWACRVVYGGRIFLRCILDMMNSLISLTAKHKLSAEFHEDIKWWDSFLSLLQWLGPFPLRPAHNWCVDRCLSNSSKGLFLGRLVLS